MLYTPGIVVQVCLSVSIIISIGVYISNRVCVSVLVSVCDQVITNVKNCI